MNGIIHSLAVNLLWLWYNFTATATSFRQDEKQVDYAGASVQQVLLDTKATDLERVGRFRWFEPVSTKPLYKFYMIVVSNQKPDTDRASGPV
jgi:hypothetical protein